MVELTHNIPTIKLTESEQDAFTFLLKVLEFNKLKTIIRVAGGWVRDKVS